MQNVKRIQDGTFEFACRIVRLHAENRTGTAKSIYSQLLRSGTSIGANLEEAEAAQSKADFITKCRIALKEARESLYWLRVIAATQLILPGRLEPLTQEAHEIVAILTTIVRNATASSRR